MGDILMVKMVEIFDTIMATTTVRATVIASSSTSTTDTDTDTNTSSARTRLSRVKSVQQTVRVVCRCSIMLGCFGVLHSKKRPFNTEDWNALLTVYLSTTNHSEELLSGQK